MIGPARRRAPVAAIAPLLLAAACMPWAVGETAETVRPGRVEPGLGVAMLAPPSEPHRPLVVPQARAHLGLRENLDIGAAWAPPFTFQARAKLRIADRPAGALASAVGIGVHGVPDVAGAGQTFWVPYLLGAVHASRREPPLLHGALRAVVPFDATEELVATLWVVPQIGLELGQGRVRWGPELGVVVPTLHPGDTQLVAAVAVRWTPRLP